MPLVQLSFPTPSDRLAVARGDAVVCIPLHGGHEHFVRCLHSVLQHTAPEVPILICDDASPDGRSLRWVRELAAGEDGEHGEHHVHYLRHERNLGFPANVNAAFACADPADVVILNSDCVVAGGWLDGLRDAAYSDSRVASASALSNNASLLTVPDRGRPSAGLPAGWTLEQAAAAVRAGSLRLHPRLPTAIGHCAYVRRSALELVGGFDEAFSPGYGEEVDFSQRCLRAGLSHVAADEVLVAHHGGASLAPDGRRNPIQDAHERIIATRYPYYHEAVGALERERHGPLARALGAARRTLLGLSVTIDARILSGPPTGTQLQLLEVIAALSRAGGLRIAVILPEDPGAYPLAALSELPGVRLLDRHEAEELGPADIVHRPYQVAVDEDLSFLAPLGDRLIVTQLDLIAYHNPSYFESWRKWQGYRRLTRSALGVADHVLFLSAHGRAEALEEDLLDPARASVLHLGVDHRLHAAGAAPEPPRGAERLPQDAEAILCLGTDFRHKNRVFALRLLRVLRERHGWEGRLVLAGPHVARGSSASEETVELAAGPGLAGAVVELGAVSEAEKAWLYQRAALVLYPTVHEGFGLVPFEAAEHDTPCLWAPVTSLAELLPAEAAGLVPWDAELGARAALELLRDPAARERNLARIRAAAARLTWDATAARLLEIYRATCDAPATPAGAIDRREGVMQGVLSEDGMRLVGPDGALPSELERPLLALATHRPIAAPMFGALKLGYRAGYVWRRRLRGSAAKLGR
jgi:glycosyltransferase involved in cell wall biosynthesis